jgi:hypothetical protein
MRRVILFALVLCAGCASGSDNLLMDSLFGDIRSLFEDHPADISPPRPTAGYSGMRLANPPPPPSGTN